MILLEKLISFHHYKTILPHFLTDIFSNRQTNIDSLFVAMSALLYLSHVGCKKSWCSYLLLSAKLIWCEKICPTSARMLCHCKPVPIIYHRDLLFSRHCKHSFWIILHYSHCLAAAITDTFWWYKMLTWLWLCHNSPYLLLRLSSF